MRPVGVQENKIKPQGSSLPKHTTVLYPDYFTSFRKVYCHVTQILEVMIHVPWLIFYVDIIREPG
jgi:hypothetical protein